MLIDTQKIVCSWENILTCTSKGNVFSVNLFDYISFNENTLKLVDENVLNDEVMTDSCDFFVELLLNDKVSGDTFKDLAPKFGSYWANISLINEHKSKIELLIKLGLLKFPDVGLDQLAECIPELIPTFIEYNFTHLLKVGLFNEIEYEESDIIYLLNSSQLSLEDKIAFCQFINEAYFEKASLSKELFESLIKLYIDSVSHKIPTHILGAMMRYSNHSTATKVQIIAHQIDYIHIEYLHIYFEELGSPYKELCTTNSNISINTTKENTELAIALAKKGYFSISKTKQPTDKIRLYVKGIFKPY